MRRRDSRRRSHGGSSCRHCVTARHRAGSGGSWRQPSAGTLRLSRQECIDIALQTSPTARVADMEVKRMDYSKEGDPRRGVSTDQLLHQLPALHRAADGEDGHGRAEPELQDGLRQQLEHGLLGLHAAHLPHAVEGDSDQRHPDPGQPRERPRVAPQSR